MELVASGAGYRSVCVCVVYLGTEEEESYRCCCGNGLGRCHREPMYNTYFPRCRILDILWP